MSGVGVQRISQILAEARRGIPLSQPSRQRDGDEAPLKPPSKTSISSQKLQRPINASGDASHTATQQPSSTKVVQLLLDLEDVSRQLNRLRGSGNGSGGERELVAALQDATSKIDRAAKQYKSSQDLPVQTRSSLREVSADLVKVLLHVLQDHLSRHAATSSFSSSSFSSSSGSNTKVLLLCRHVLRLQAPLLDEGCADAALLNQEDAVIVLFAMQQLQAAPFESAAAAAADESEQLLLLSVVEAVLDVLAVACRRLTVDVREDVVAVAAAQQNVVFSMFGAVAEAENATAAFGRVSNEGMVWLLEAASLGVVVLLRYCQAETNRCVDSLLFPLSISCRCLTLFIAFISPHEQAEAAALGRD
jgi:hypothetical protein